MNTETPITNNELKKEFKEFIDKSMNEIQRLNKEVEDLRKDRQRLQEFISGLDLKLTKRTAEQVMLLDTEALIPSREAEKLTEEFGEDALSVIDEILKAGDYKKPDTKFIFWNLVREEIINPEDKRTCEVMPDWTAKP